MVDSEQMAVTGGAGTNTWTVTRGAGSTTAATHSSGAYVFQSATSLIPIEPVWFEPMVTRYDPALMRNSFERYYETVIVSEHSELKGVKTPATYQVMTNFLNWASRGNPTPTTSDSAAYTWDFSPTLSADDLVGMGGEFFNDTAAYHIAAMYCDQMVIDIVRGSESAMVTLDFMGQQAFKMGAKSPGLTRTGLEIVNPAFTSTYLDSSTIGTTLVNDVASAKITLKNGFQQLFFLNGVLYPTAVARPTRNLDVELVKWFDDATELDNAMNAVGKGVERKIRLDALSEQQIPGSSSYYDLRVDAYLYWDTFPFKVDKEVWMVTYTGRTVYDVSNGRSWNISLVNDLAAIP